MQIEFSCEERRSVLCYSSFGEASFSFGTNDLTQTTLGFSRDDAESKFIPVYLEKKVMKDNPFAVLDRMGVGFLMNMAVEKARATKPGILMGICGEHGGEPRSINSAI